MEVYDFIWDRGIIPTISVFLWRLLANRIPVHAKVQWRGVSHASKCRCCLVSGSETGLHLFVNGRQQIVYGNILKDGSLMRRSLSEEGRIWRVV